MSINETSLQVIEKQGILKRIINFFKKITNKKEINYNFFSDSQNSNSNNLKSDNFLNSIKYSEDPDKKLLLKIRDELERIGINKKNAFLLTKDLTDEQRDKLIELYKEQINSLNISVNNYKEKIIKIKNSL